MMNAASRKAEEQTMEDILNSIRKIMADDQKPVPAKAPEPILPSPAAPESGSVEEDIKALRSALNTIRGEMEGVSELVAQEVSQSVDDDSAFDGEDVFAKNAEPQGLVSSSVEQSVRSSFAGLSQATAMNRELDVGALAENLLRPMLQQWLDAHLPGLVEKLVREEITRLSGR